MPGPSLDQIIMDSLGLKEMTISRLLWEIADWKDKAEVKDGWLRAHHPAVLDELTAYLASREPPT